MNQTKK